MAVPILPLRLAISAIAVLSVAGCSVLEAGSRAIPGPPTGATAQSGVPGGDRFPDIIVVELHDRGDRVFDVVVTISSPYDTPQRYADGWRVIDADGNVLGTHTLLHDHADEQPFTRTQRGVLIPTSIEEVIVEGHDRSNGYGGLMVNVPVPES